MLVWDRRNFTLAFVLVALGTLIAYGAIVYAATMVALGEIGREAALSQWNAAQRSLANVEAGQLQATTERAEHDELIAMMLMAQLDQQWLKQAFAPQVLERAGLRFAAVADVHGRLLYAAGDDASQAEAVLGMAPARAALLGKPTAGIWLLGNDPWLIAATPIRTSPDNDALGVVVTGRPVDSAVIEQAKAMLGSDLTLRRNGRVVGSTRGVDKTTEDAQRAACEALIGGSSTLIVRAMPQGGSLLTGRLLDSDGQELGCLQVQMVNASTVGVQRAITISSLVAILLGLAASYVLARAVGGRLSASAEALAARERENARLYAEVQQLNRRLEGLIGERTTQLRAAKTELQEMQTQMIRSDRLATLGTLTAGLVSDLAKPVATILNDVQMLLRDEQDAQRRARLEEARAAALSLQATMHRIRIFAGAQRVRRELIDLNEVTREALDLLRQDLELSKIEYALELDERLPKIMADRTQAQQILFNLINRAREALEQSAQERKLVVRTAQGNGWARLIVLDNGPALSAEQIERLFDPFAGASGGIGMGLSLYICQGIVESYGGRILAANREDGPGVAFTVELPTGAT